MPGSARVTRDGTTLIRIRVIGDLLWFATQIGVVGEGGEFVLSRL